MAAIYEPRIKPPDCVPCPFGRKGSAFVPGHGDTLSRLVVIGEEPGACESGDCECWPAAHPRYQPFVGKSGRALEVGLGSRTGAFLTNVRKCRYDKQSKEEYAASIKACRPYLQKELDALTEARVILCVGGDAVRAIFGDGQMVKFHGTAFTRAERNAMVAAVGNPGLVLPPKVHTIYSTVHPAFAMRGLPQMWPSIHKTVERAKNASLRDTTTALRDFVFNINPTPDELSIWITNLRPGDAVAVDVETPRNESPVKTINLCGLAKGNDAIVFPWVSPYVEIVRSLLADGQIIKVGHNFAFDQCAFMANDADVAWPIGNTIEAESIIRPPFKEAADRRWLALSSCLPWYYDGIPYWKEPEDSFIGAFYRAAYPNVPDSLRERLYCALDCWYTRLLWTAQVDTLKRVGMWRTYSEYVAPVGPVLARMEYRGLPVDEERRKELLAHFGAIKQDLSTRIQGFAGAYHDKRIKRLEEALQANKELEAHELETHPLFTSGTGTDEVSLSPCAKHPDYRGITKRSKCVGCFAIYNGAGSLRGRIKDLRGRASICRRRIKSIGPTFKETSSDHWRWLLFTETEKGGLGLTPLDFTEKRQDPKVDDENIEALQRAHPDIPVLSWRVEIQRTAHTLKVLEIPVDALGRAHPATSQHRTETQRLASGKDDDEDRKVRGAEAGNIQNKKDVERSIFCAGTADSVFVTWDLKQIELWDMAWKAKDEDLLAALFTGADIHTLNAHALFGCGESREMAEAMQVPFEGQMRSARTATKRFTHGTDYGLGDKKAGRMYQPCGMWPLQNVMDYLIARWTATNGEVGISPDTVRRLFRSGDPVAHSRLYEHANTTMAWGWRMAYFKRWPGLKRFQDWVVKTVEADGALTNSFGYRLQYHNFTYKNGKRILQDREPALAFIPQSDVAFMSKVIMRPENIERCFSDHGGEFLLQNHDEFGGRIPKAALTDFYHASKAIVEREFPELGTHEKYGVFKSRADFSVGWNWGKKHLHSVKCYKPAPILQGLICGKIENPKGLEEWHEAA